MESQGPQQNPPIPLSKAPYKEEVHEKAWKHVGYRHFSRFLGSHENFLQVRVYRTLNARVLLAMQDYIAELEIKLDKLEDQMSLPSEPDVHNGSFRQETSKERMQLVWEIQERLKAYNEYISTYSQLSRRHPVYHGDTQSIRNFLGRWPGAIADEEACYLDQTDDLIYVTERKDSFLSRRFRCFPSGIMRRRAPGQGSGDSDFVMNKTILHDAEKVETVYLWGFAVLGLVMLISPLWIFLAVKDPLLRSAVVTAFIFVFLAFTASATTARPFETLAATAAYAAVLVVYLQAI